ncbi:DUF3562 domain-containing protein [Cupriavidus necator]
MNHSQEPTPEYPTSATPSAGAPSPARRPLSGSEAIERIARTYNVPKEAVQGEFWNAWDALLIDAKCLDYVLVLAEKRVKEAIRRRRQSPDAAG